ncbi:MAG: 7-carboxy-7-deazaguanine synthase QueE [Desulfuromonadales bacterium]|nr:7-carboxy-7-deazaguanine synthase QueE [Desulfuromonadales bacterium]
MSDAVCISEIFSSIQGEGLLAGRRQIFIRLAECNLDCGYCDTDHAGGDTCRVEISPGSSKFMLLSQPLLLHDVLMILENWCSGLPGAHHSISITGGEPLLYADGLSQWLPELRQLLPIHLETNGSMPGALERVVQLVDYVSMDMKLPSTSGCTEHLWNLHREFLRVAQGRNASVKVVICDDTLQDEIDQVCGIIEEVDRATPLFLQPLSLVEGGIGITVGHLLRLQETASARLPDVRVIPQMHRMLGAL